MGKLKRRKICLLKQKKKSSKWHQNNKTQWNHDSRSYFMWYFFSDELQFWTLYFCNHLISFIYHLYPFSGSRLSTLWIDNYKQLFPLYSTSQGKKFSLISNPNLFSVSLVSRAGVLRVNIPLFSSRSSLLAEKFNFAELSEVAVFVLCIPSLAGSGFKEWFAQVQYLLPASLLWQGITTRVWGFILRLQTGR